MGALKKVHNWFPEQDRDEHKSKKNKENLNSLFFYDRNCVVEPILGCFASSSG